MNIEHKCDKMAGGPIQRVMYWEAGEQKWRHKVSGPGWTQDSVVESCQYCGERLLPPAEFPESDRAEADRASHEALDKVMANARIRQEVEREQKIEHDLGKALEWKVKMGQPVTLPSGHRAECEDRPSAKPVAQRIMALEADLREMTAKRDKLDQLLTEARAQVQQSVIQIKDARAALDSAHKHESAASRQVAVMGTELEARDKRESELVEETKSLRTRFKATLADLEEMTARAAALKKECETWKIQDREMLRPMAKLQDELARKQTGLNFWKDAYVSCTKQAESVIAERNALKAEVESLSKECQSLRDLDFKRATTLRKLHDEKDRAMCELAVARKGLEEMTAKAATLENAAKSWSGNAILRHSRLQAAVRRYRDAFQARLAYSETVDSVALQVAINGLVAARKALIEMVHESGDEPEDVS